MKQTQMSKPKATLKKLHKDAQNDYFHIAKGMGKAILRPIKPADFENAYLPINEEQGSALQDLIIKNNLKNVVEFGTSFGISTIYLAEAVRETEGKVITTELLNSKAEKAQKNIEDAGLSEYVTFKIGDAMDTLKDLDIDIDFLFLDGWKDLYLPLFQMLEPRFHNGTVIYADNTDMADTQVYTDFVLNKNKKYQSHYLHSGKALVTHVMD